MKKSICFITRIKQILKLNKRCPPDNFCDRAPGFIFSVAVSVWSLCRYLDTCTQSVDTAVPSLSALSLIGQ